MGFLDDLKTRVRGWFGIDEMLDEAMRKRYDRNALLRDYYRGIHRKQLTVRSGQADDNITLNYLGLVVERGISMLLGQGVEFDMGEDEGGPRQEFIDEIWSANKRDILLHKVAQYGGSLGTCYLKILPEAIESREDENKLVARLVPLDPLLMEIETVPEDIDQVLRYVMRYNIKGPEGEEIARKEVTERNLLAVEEEGADGPQIIGFETVSWMIRNYQAGRNGVWELMSEQEWPFEFPPIMHWQNLPLAYSAYGMADVEQVVDLQDRINFIASNISKIIRYHAHPKTWGRGVGTQGEASWGADEMITLGGENAMIQNLEMQSDLQSSQAYLLNLRQSLFDITRTVDLTSMADKLGALTNFGLRVLFFDALAKLGTKREIYGEALVEINHRLLVISGVNPNDGGEVVWPDTLPEDEREEVAGLQFDLGAGLVSKQTAAQERGYDWETEQERMEGERTSEGNLGELFLRQFEQGQGVQR